MDDYKNASPITPSIFVHSNPLKETHNDKEPRDENLKVFRQIQGDRNKETPTLKPLNPHDTIQQKKTT